MKAARRFSTDALPAIFGAMKGRASFGRHGWLAVLVLLGACNEDPYLIVRTDAVLADFGTADSRRLCEPTNGGVEACDGIDNDCDGQVDEDFLLQTDPENCGRCGKSCLVNGALSTCELGVCRYLGCAPGFLDLNNNVDDGCEYECTPSGSERCDGVDNDCNGKIDETFDLSRDVDNCGKCGHVCRLANAVPRCEGAKCQILRCNGGFINKDGRDDNGCEEPCEVSNGGVEICDDIDNDCNGVKDDPQGVPIDFANDNLNCGSCGVVCARANATAHCALGNCVLDSCKGDHVDADGDPLNGCECLPTGPEVCDGRDNDCNGEIDEGLDALGPCGSTTGECRAGTFVCELGALSCVGGTGPQPEVCDGKDNDCNGKADDGLPPSLGSCGSSVGECQLGTLVCQAGKTTCVGAIGASPELCDGKDNDCNGKIDDGLAASLGACGSAVGECKQGSYKCQAGGLVCVGEKKPAPEVCDGKDNDCSGVVDDHLPPSLGVCGTAQGECRPGTLVCKAGAPSCEGRIGPSPEVCDGKDNDCNGLVDDAVPGYPKTCGNDTGECVAGVLRCELGTEVCIGRVGPSYEMCDRKDNDCDGTTDATSCVFPALGRERRLDELDNPDLGGNNSVQLDAAVGGSLVYAVWLDRRSGRGDIYANWSTNGGRSWQSADYGAATESDGDGHKVEPKIGLGRRVAAETRAYLAYGRYNADIRQVYFRYGANSGRSFGNPRRLDANDARDKVFIRLAVAAGSGGGADYLAACWEEIETLGAIRPNIRCSINVADGVNSGWSASVRANGVANNAILPEVAIDRDYVYVTWQEGTLIKAARASLAGHPAIAFGNEVTLNKGPGQKPRIATNGAGGVIVVWEDVRDPLINIRANRSLNSGATWLADGLRVDNDVVNGDSTAPMVVMRPGSGQRAFIAWSDTNRGRADIYVNTSTDGGTSWGFSATRVNGGEAGAAASFAPHLALAPNNDNVYVVWEDKRNGSERDIYLGLSRDDGITWNVPDYRLDESPAGRCEAYGPRVLPSAGRAAVIWMDNRSGSGANLITGPNADIHSSYVE